jgi:hypothetical protein
LKTNIPQSADFDYQLIVTSLFGGHHSTHAFQQKALSSLARVQKPLPAIKKILSVKYIYKKTTNKTNRCNKKNSIIRFACKMNRT